MPEKGSVLILGSASWLGSLLLNSDDLKNYEFYATYYNVKLPFNSDIRLLRAKNLDDYKSLLKKHSFKVILNFLRGENETGLEIHKEILKHCRAHSTFYVYCSSALALDGYTNTALKDTLEAKSISVYGTFKANCEKLLYDSGIDWCILRFSSLQGYCPHKKIRNEVFLSKLSVGEVVWVDKNIIQNRMLAIDAIRMIKAIIKTKKTGIIHLGTTDASDEIDFLRKQAFMFGYQENQVISNEKNRNVNLNCIPSKLEFMPLNDYPYTEDLTLSHIAEIESYKKYRAKDEF